jgi:hypothetical protein
MPVSKKRKKDGKPVARSAPAPEPHEEHAHPDAKPSHAKSHGKPTNPFVAQQQSKGRGAQRGR